MDLLQLRAVLIEMLSFLLLLVAMQPPPQVMHCSTLQQRLLPGFHGHQFQGRDVFAQVSAQSWLFWKNTGETRESFLQLVADTSQALFALNIYGHQRQRIRRQMLSLHNQILLVLMWLRKYPHVDTLALMFDIDPTSITRIVYKIIPRLWRYFHNQIRWPNNAEWANLMGNWSEFPNVVGAIDSTPHEIYRPLTEPQRPFYSGHRHYHCFNTQLIIDNNGHLRFVQAGFFGSTHDATSYRLMTPIGPGHPLSLPNRAKILADKAYPGAHPLLTAVRAQQMRGLNRRDRRRARRFNRYLSRRRIKVEHVFKEMKTYRAISSIWRHPRWLMPVCIELAAFLAERRVRLFENI